MEIVHFGDLSDEDRAQIEGDEADPFDADGIGLVFRPKDRHVGIRDEAGRLIASAGFLLADVEVGGRERFGVLGIGGVIVAAAHRGRGLARTVVEAALRDGAELAPEYALLFCHEDRSGLYEKLGFTGLEWPVTVLQPRGTVTVPQLAMWRALTGERAWPAGPAVLRSLPF